MPEIFRSTAGDLHGSACLVTGGAGFIGSHLVDALLGTGASVRVLDNFSTGFERNLQHLSADARIEIINGDGADAATVDRAVEGVKYIFHQAAMASVPRSLREPALCHAWCCTSTVNLLTAASRHRVRRMVLASTSAAYGNSPFAAKRESDPAAPLSPYAAAKLAAEQYCRAFAAGGDLETVVLRYFNVYGPRQDPESEYSAVIPQFVSRILSDQPPVVYGDGRQSRDFVFVSDVAQANLRAAVAAGISGEAFNIGRGSGTTLLELLQTLSKLLDRKIKPVHEPPREGDIRDSMADISAARRRLGFDPQVSLRSGLAASIAYYTQTANA